MKPTYLRLVAFLLLISFSMASCSSSEGLSLELEEEKTATEEEVVTSVPTPTETEPETGAIVPADYVSKNVFTKALAEKDSKSGVFTRDFTLDIKAEAFLETVWILTCDAYYTSRQEGLRPTVQIKLVNGSDNVLYYSMPYEIGSPEEYVIREWRVPPIRQSYDTVRLIFDVPYGVTLSIHDMKNIENTSHPTDYDDIKYHAHQGFSGYSAGSSADSFETAGMMGYKSCITIPKFTKDGVGVCFHDDDTIRKKLRYDDGSSIPAGSEDDKKISEFTFEELQKFDVGVKKSKIYQGQEVCTLDEFFRICAKYDMDPIFSVHPDLTREQWLYVRDLLIKYNLLHKFWVKTGRPSVQKITTEIFDDDIAGYIMIQGQSSTWDPKTQAKSCKFDLSRHTVIMEYFYAAITEEKIQTALDEGFRVSVATTGDGISGQEMRRLMDLGVREFTIDHHCSMGLNW